MISDVLKNAMPICDVFEAEKFIIRRQNTKA